MYRNKLEEIAKEKGMTNKRWAEESGVSIDTITRIIHPKNPEKDSPSVNTLEELCRPLEIELWEIFYMGDKSFVDLQVELIALKTERDNLIVENGVMKEKIDFLTKKVDTLKDELIEVYAHIVKNKSIE